MLLKYSHSCLLLSCLPAGPRRWGPMPPPAFCAHGLRQGLGWARRRRWPCPTTPVPRWCRQHGDVSAPGPACVGTGGFVAPRGASPATADGRVTAFESAFPSYLIACKNVCHVRLLTGNLYQDRKERSNQRRDIAASEPSPCPGTRLKATAGFGSSAWARHLPSRARHGRRPSLLRPLHLPAWRGSRPAAGCSPSERSSAPAPRPRGCGRPAAPGRRAGRRRRCSWPACTELPQLAVSGYFGDLYLCVPFWKKHLNLWL